MYTPFPVGTVRGPFSCGYAGKLEFGFQYCVKEPSGAWRHFIGGKKESEWKATRKEAEGYASTLKPE